MDMSYRKEVRRIAKRVRTGGDLYSLASSSEYVCDTGWFSSVMRESNHPEEYAQMTDSYLEPAEWIALTSHITFFALCADVRQCLDG
jgi:hypothetical protein